MEPVQPDHPQHVLLFALEGQPDDAASDEMLDTVRELRRAHSWTVSPPELVDEVDEEGVGESGEGGIRTVGLFVKVHSAHPPFGGRIPVAVERAEYEDVKMLVERLARFSVELQEEIIVELAGEAIGWIELGVPDTGLTEAFLDEWRKSIDAREAEDR